MKMEVYLKKTLKKIDLPEGDKALIEADLRREIEEKRAAGMRDWRIRRKMGQPVCLADYCYNLYGDPTEKEIRRLQKWTASLRLSTAVFTLLAAACYLLRFFAARGTVQVAFSDTVMREATLRMAPLVQVMEGLALGFFFAAATFALLSLLADHCQQKLGGQASPSAVLGLLHKWAARLKQALPKRES